MRVTHTVWAIQNESYECFEHQYPFNQTKYSINSGTGRLVVDDADVYAELKSFFNEYSIPLLWNNQFQYAGASEFDCSKKNLYADQELVCIGKLPLNNRCASISDLEFSFGDSLLADENMLKVSYKIQIKAPVYTF